MASTAGAKGEASSKNDGVDEADQKRDYLFLLTPYRFCLPKTKSLDFGKVLYEISDYALTEKYYRTLDFATKLREEVVRVLEHFHGLLEAPHPADNLLQLDDTARRLYAAATPLEHAIDDYMETLSILVALEENKHIRFRMGCNVEWTTSFPASANADEDEERGRFRKGSSVRYEMCHILFLRAVVEYTRSARGLYKLHKSHSSTVAAQTWQNLRVSAGIFFHGCVTSAHDHNDYDGEDELGPETTAGVLSLLSALILAQTQHVVYARAVMSGNLPLALERVCSELIKAYDRVGNVLGNITMGDNDDLKQLMTANDWLLTFVKAMYLKNGVLLRARQEKFDAAEVWANVGLSLTRARAHTRMAVMEDTPKAFRTAMKSEKTQFTQYVADYKEVNEKLGTARGPMAHLRSQLMAQLNTTEEKISIAGLSAAISSIVPYDGYSVQEHQINEYVDVFSGPLPFRRREYNEKREQLGDDIDHLPVDEDGEETKEEVSLEASMSHSSLGSPLQKRDSLNSSYFGGSTVWKEGQLEGTRWSSTQMGRTRVLFERIRTKEEHGMVDHGIPFQAPPKPGPTSTRFEELDSLHLEQAGLAVSKKKCGMCRQMFASLGGKVTLKAIMDKQHEWGLPVDHRKRANTATVMYADTPICVFCLQFCYPETADKAGGTSVASTDSFGQFMVKSSFKKPSRAALETPAKIVNSLISPPKRSRFRALSPVAVPSATTILRRPRTSPSNVNLARTLGHQAEARMLRLEDEAIKPRHVDARPVTRLPHYHSPSFPKKTLKESKLIPKQAVASHGWGLDGNVDDVYYAAALGYDDSVAHDRDRQALETHFAKTNELKPMKLLFARLHSLKSYTSNADKLGRKGVALGKKSRKATKTEVPDPHNLPRFKIKIWLDLYEDNHEWVKEAMRKSRHIASIPEAGASDLLRTLSTTVETIDWVQFLKILKTMVTPCTKCPWGRCTTFMFRPNVIGHDYCECGHSLRNHVAPSFSTDNIEDAKSKSLIFSQLGDEADDAPSNWISPGRKARARPPMRAAPSNSTILESLLQGGNSRMFSHYKHIQTADEQYKRLLPVVKKLNEDAALQQSRSHNASGIDRRRLLSQSLRAHHDAKVERAQPGHMSLAFDGRDGRGGVPEPSRQIKIACGLCYFKFTLANLPCAATRGTLIRISEEFKAQTERRHRAEFLKGKHVIVDAESVPVSGSRMYEKYGRVVKTNAGLGQLFVVHLDGSRAWYKIDDSWEWEVEDKQALITKNKKSKKGGKPIMTKQHRQSTKPLPPEVEYKRNRTKSLKKYDKVRICIFCAQIYEDAFETERKKQVAEATAMRERNVSSRKNKVDMFADFKREEAERKRKEEEEKRAAEQRALEEEEAQRHEAEVGRNRRKYQHEQRGTDVEVEHLPTATERRQLSIKRWEARHNKKYYEVSREERQKVDMLAEQEEIERMSYEAESLNVILDKVGLNFTSIPFSLEQLRAMTLRRRIRVVASIRIQALARGFVQRIRIVRYLGGEGASIEQNIDELKDKIEKLKETKRALEESHKERTRRREGFSKK